MLEDTVYCNARNMSNQAANGWNKDGSLKTTMQFKNYSSTTNLACPNETDQFAVSNNKAKLTYPVALATHEELYTLTNNNSSTYYSTLTNTGAIWWGLSPYYFDYGNAEAVKLQKAITALPAKQQLAFNLRYYDDLSYKEIAIVTGSTEATVKANYHFAKEKIIKYMNTNNL